MTFSDIPINQYFIIVFYNLFFIYIKMSKNLSAKYYPENKERLQIKKKVVKDIKIFPRKKKKKSDNMVLKVTKISKKI